MKRLQYWLWKGLTAVSLLLWVVTIIVWVRSYWVGDAVQSRRVVHGSGGLSQRFVGITLARGGLLVSRVTSVVPDATSRKYGVDPATVHDTDRHISFVPQDYPATPGTTTNSVEQTFIGFKVWRLTPQTPGGSAGLEGTAVVVPLWIAALIFGVLPAVRALLTRTRMKAAKR